MTGSAFYHGCGCLVAPSAMVPRATRWQIWLTNPEQYFFLGECLAMDWTPRPGPSVLSIPQHRGQTALLHPSDTCTRCGALGTRIPSLCMPLSACPGAHPVYLPLCLSCMPPLPPLPSSPRLPFADPPCRSPPSSPFPQPITFFPSLLITSGQLHRVPAGPGPAAAAAPRSH